MIAPDLLSMVRPIDSLKEDPSNARKHDDKNIAAIAESLREFGQRKPVVALASGVVIAGNGTLRAAKMLGWDSLAVATFEDEGKARAFAIADNQTALLAEWDDTVLAQTLEGMSDELRKAVGFSEGEIERLVAELAPPADDEVPEVPVEPETRLGDVYVLGEHRFTCGDSTNPTDVARALAGSEPFQMVTDPPYGVEYDPEWRNEAAEAGHISCGDRAVGDVLNDERRDWTATYSLFTGDVAYVWHADRFCGEVADNLEAAGIVIRGQIIWRKSHFAISRGAYHWQHEPCWYAVRKGRSAKWCGDRSQSTVWDITHMKSETGHGTQKPVEAMERPMRNHGVRGDVVYDPFLGSGTSIIAAERAGRVARGLELSPAYCDVIVARWEKFSGKKAERIRA
jgi:DNA modification methylase